MKTKATADLWDEYGDKLQLVEPIFRNYGAKKTFGGEIVTVKVFEDNVLVRKTLEKEGYGKVLVVDGGGSTRCALLGDRLAAMARNHGWEGVIIYGCIRDSAEIVNIKVGVKAVNTCPAKSIKRGEGQTDLPLRFAGVVFKPGAYLYADDDGILLSDSPLNA